MSNERFDNLMKRNLESVRPGYQPSAWNRFQKRLPPVGFWAWLLNYGGWVISGLMLAGWVTTLYTLHENKQVIEELRKRPAVAVPIPSVTSTPISPQIGSATNHRVDTVYVVQRTIVEHRHVYEPIGQNYNRVSRRAESVPLTDSVLAEVPISRMNDQRTVNNIRDRKANTGDPVVKLTTPSKAARTVGVPDALLRQRNEPPVAVTPTNSMNQAIAQATATIPNDSAQVALAKPESVRSESATSNRNGESAARSNVAPPDSVAQKPTIPLAANSAQASAEPAKQSRPPFRLSSLQPRIGIESMATFNGVGVGPAIELFPTENLGLSIGLQASQFQAENHKELRDFNSATGTEFVEQYRAFLPAQYDQIKDIAVRTSLVSLPVNLKYYLPLRPAWSLLFQAGTSLDLAAYQQVSYESYYRGEVQYHSFEIDARPRFFHNFMFGAGVQYQRSRMSVQLSPYYIYDFRSLANTQTGSNVGLKASVWLNLYK